MKDYNLTLRILRASHTLKKLEKRQTILCFFFYEWMKRELKIIKTYNMDVLFYECLCDERLK